MSFVQLYYHIVWATKQREPLLTPQLEIAAYEFILVKALHLGARVYAINGMPDHVHLVVSIPPQLALSEFVGQVKGVSSRRLNEDYGGTFAWQAKYSAFTFDRRALPNVIHYVRAQKSHHAANSTIPACERRPPHRAGRRPAGAPA